MVDEVDYQWALQWLWSVKWSRGGHKFYLRRNLVRWNGAGSRIQRTLFLHVAIMHRTGRVPPSPLHKIVDHRDGNSMHCQRENLRYATGTMNRLNINGDRPYDIEELAHAV